jgi:hypothetical protein
VGVSLAISVKVCSQVQETASTDSSTGFIIEGNWREGGREQQIKYRMNTFYK